MLFADVPTAAAHLVVALCGLVGAAALNYEALRRSTTYRHHASFLETPVADPTRTGDG